MSIDRSIYPMPLFPTLTVTELGTTEAFYHALGFISLATIPDGQGGTALVHLRRERCQDILLVPGAPSPGSTSLTVAAHEEDLDALATRLRSELSDPAVVVGPADTPWFTSDLTVTDPDGQVLIFTRRREGTEDAATAWAQDFEGDWEGREG